jgi:uncharacterized protein (TIGR02231 family)
VQTGQTATMVARVNIDALQGTSVKLEFSYQLGDAWWWPVYDARLNTESGKIDLVQLAQVQQRTGEDWSNVKLTLSTARPSAGAALPDLQTWFLLTEEVDKLAKTGEQLDDLAAVRNNMHPPARSPHGEADGRWMRNCCAPIWWRPSSRRNTAFGSANVPSDDS